MALRGILFDKDGTLLDFQATWMPVLREVALAMAKREGAAPAERLLELAGYDTAADTVRAGSLFAAGNSADLAEAWSALLPGHRTEDLVALLDRMFEQGGARHATEVTALRPLLGRLRGRGLKVGVATNDSERGARTSLEPFGVLELFDFVAGYDSGHGAKPGPGMVAGFCAALELEAAEVAVVGDNLHDLEMGHRAGAGLLVGVLTGNSATEELAPYAHHVLDSIAGLEDLLERL